MFLSPADLWRVTRRKRYKAQAKALDRLGIRYKLADNGEPLVRPEWLDDAKPAARNSGPRWDRINL